jgi:hypothetical protein
MGNRTLTHWLALQLLPHAPLLIFGHIYATLKAFIAPHDQKLMAHS